MIFNHELTLPKNDPTTVTIHEPLTVSKGLVYQVEFLFPPGCAGLAHLAVFDGGHQCWPSTLGQTYHTDGEKISFPDSYLKLAEPFQFELWGYNLDETYEHVVQVRIGLVTNQVFIARFLPTVGYEQLAELLKTEQVKQEEEKTEVMETPFDWIEEPI